MQLAPRMEYDLFELRPMVSGCRAFWEVVATNTNRARGGWLWAAAQAACEEGEPIRTGNGDIPGEPADKKPHPSVF